ncbi:MAG: Fur family transcriptional regulator [Fusicatenibacter sp.]
MNKADQNQKLTGRKEEIDSKSYQKETMKKEVVMELLRKQGFRITRQRKLLIDIILEETCSCCKEVYVIASKKDAGIGIATVYRTVDALEQAGALKRKTAYQLRDQQSTVCKKCLIELEDHSFIELDGSSMKQVIESGIKKCGFSNGEKVKEITWLSQK